MKRILSLLLITTMLLMLLVPGMAFAAKSKKMDTDLPPWTEDNARQYVQDYIDHKNLDVLYSYYDLQIRRYMPEDTYQNLLSEIEWLTGGIVGLDEDYYDCFEEEEYQTKTHVFHLHMEKQDLKVYFTHKNQDNDWEVMYLEFSPTENMDPTNSFSVDEEAAQKEVYTEREVVIGEGTDFPLQGILTMPVYATIGKKFPACVLVHDVGPMDKNATLGATHFFEDLAHELAEHGIVTLRYDKRTFVYGETADMTVREEVIEDAVLAGQLLAGYNEIDSDTILVVGHGFSGPLVPRIASEIEGLFDGMILIGSSTVPYVKQLFESADLNGMTDKEISNLRDLVRNIGDISEDKARATELFGKNGYYFHEMESYDHIRMISKMQLPTYIVQGRNDAYVTEDDGWRKYSEELSPFSRFVSWKCYRGLNHLLANDLSVDLFGKPQYAVDAGIDGPAVRDLADWINAQQH